MSSGRRYGQCRRYQTEIAPLNVLVLSAVGFEPADCKNYSVRSRLVPCRSHGFFSKSFEFCGSLQKYVSTKSDHRKKNLVAGHDASNSHLAVDLGVYFGWAWSNTWLLFRSVWLLKRGDYTFWVNNGTGSFPTRPLTVDLAWKVVAIREVIVDRTCL